MLPLDRSPSREASTAGHYDCGNDDDDDDDDDIDIDDFVDADDDDNDDTYVYFSGCGCNGFVDHTGGGECRSKDTSTGRLMSSGYI